MPPDTVMDDAYLNTCTNAANQWAFDRRKAAGYVDDPAVAPNDRVRLGTMMYACSLYRERGAPEGFASFAEFPVGAPTLTTGLGQIMRLLGVGRPQVA